MPPDPWTADPDRDLDAGMRTAIESPYGAPALLVFARIEHPAIDGPMRVVADVFDYFLGGQLWKGIPFTITLVTDSDAPPATELRLPNIDRRIGRALRQLPDRARVSLAVHSADDFDLAKDPRAAVATPVPLYAFEGFELVDITGDAEELTGRLMLRDFAQEPWPGVFATQSRLPGLFR